MEDKKQFMSEKSREQIEHRKETQERFRNRKLERQVLIFKSNQPGLDLKDIERLGNMELEESDFVSELARKRG